MNNQIIIKPHILCNITYIHKKENIYIYKMIKKKKYLNIHHIKTTRKLKHFSNCAITITYFII